MTDIRPTNLPEPYEAQYRVTSAAEPTRGDWPPPWQPTTEPRPVSFEQPVAPKKTGVWGWLGRTWPFLLLALSKLKWLAFLFKFKAFTTLFSMFVSLFAYAVFFGWRFAAGFVALLFIHELGHAAVMRWQGVKTSPIVFIPFLGAVIGMREMPADAYREAQMALGGPILGSLGAVACLGLWQMTNHPIFVALAYTGFMLNLFNLIPVSPLDGGRAMAAIAPWGWGVGLVVLLFLFLQVHSLILGLILVVGGLEVFRRWQNRKNEQAYYSITGQQRLQVTLVYFGLIALLGLGMFALQSHLLFHQPT